MIYRVLFLIVFWVTVVLTATGCAAPSAGISRVGFAIQVGAFSEVKNAERLSNKLQQKGIEAFYFKKDNGVYAVRFGDFESKEKARKAAQRLVADRMIGSYFIAPPQKIAVKKSSELAWEKAPEPSLKKLSPVVPKKKVEQPGGEAGPTSGGKGHGDMGVIAARTAERFVGIPYRWGGDTVVDGMDCSGFVRAVYNLCGVNIPRTSREQFRVGENVGKTDLQDGDLVFFGASGDEINHVGIYVGNGRFVHAPRRGDDIKVSTLDENYFAKKFIGAKRYF
ncbi:NlpC/P60 family protein [Geotalea uraniireducens]|uniref:NLP/P60 protein n=1 Tax=Geotalea uraniireducens (strain Rf4) TaxID=351605 RepID=A5GEX2_GEOUR|nr:NlpC/P60 family protein [Geotalea uraniireducens]ABQ25977.1 NLP/P60 protein [Geotalea uraniireducens Rf4]